MFRFVKSHVRIAPLVCLLLPYLTAHVHGQTTQGTIAGRVFDRHDARPLPAAKVTAFGSGNQEIASFQTDSGGFYSLGLLSPGLYRIRAEANGYQAQEVYNLELLVASQLQLTFQLRPERDVFGLGTNHFAMVGNDRIIPFFGEDTKVRLTPVEVLQSDAFPLQPVVSYVVDSREIEALPFAGRDVYATLALQAGITSDAATARGLGLSVNGQRPSASNYLLDGVENNNYLVSGPLITVVPEAIQEYRISTNSFSVEYGGTAGYIANAVTRSGGNQWHGASYLFWKNDHLDANDFQRNAAQPPVPVTPLRQSEPGLLFSGPLIRHRLYISASGDYTHFRSSDPPQNFILPTTQYPDFVKAGTIARSLLDRFTGPEVIGAPDKPTADVMIAPPSSASVDQFTALVRVDALFHHGERRLMIRPLLATFTRPDFLWTPYKDFITPLRQTNAGVASSFTSALWSGSNEIRFGFSSEYLDFSRRWPGVPTLSSDDLTTLPGSPAYYGFQQRGKDIEIGEHLLHPVGRHLLRFGGSAILRGTQGYLTAGRDSLVSFANFSSFALDTPLTLTTSISRSDPTLYSLPSFDRKYRNIQTALFAEDNFRLRNRLTFDYGLRYENFGAPVNDGVNKDALVQLGPGQTFGERLTSAKLVFPGPGDERLYDPDNRDFSFRGGFAYSLQKKGKLVLRGSYGLFYDTPFDNLWENLRNNNFTTASFTVTPGQPINYLQPILSSLSPYVGYPYSRAFPNLVLYQPGLRNGYAENFFLGLQYRIGTNSSLELNGLGSLGRRLITTDLVNRTNSVPLAVSFTGQFNASLPEISYRGSQGQSDYEGLTMVARHRHGSLQFQVGYTFSHAIDNQSDPLLGDFFDLSFTRIVSGASSSNGTGFTQQFNSHADRADADFDQRQNLVGYAIWTPVGWPRYRRAAPLFRHWTLSALAAARSGFPYSVYVQPTQTVGSQELVNNRADIVAPNSVYTSQDGYPGGVLLLNRAAFAVPPPGVIGNSGRNAFRGPGLGNLDFSLSRSIDLNLFEKHWRATLRADAFNLLNHANLNNPNALLTASPATSPDFGVATFGRLGQTTGFPAVAPLNETARQVQLMLRIEF